MDYYKSGGYAPHERWKWPSKSDSTPYPAHRSKAYPDWEAWAKEWRTHKEWWNQDEGQLSRLHDFAPPITYDTFISTINKTFPLGVVGNRAVEELKPPDGKTSELTERETQIVLRAIEQGNLLKREALSLVDTHQIESLLQYVALNSIPFQKGPSGEMGKVNDMTLNRRITGWWHHRDYWPDGSLKTITFAYYYKTVTDPFANYLNSSTENAPWNEYFKEKYLDDTSYHRRYGGSEKQQFHLLVLTNAERVLDRKNETPYANLWNIILVNSGSSTSEHFGRPFVVGTKADFIYSGINPPPMKYIPCFVANLTSTTMELIISQLRKLKKRRKRKG